MFGPEAAESWWTNLSRFFPPDVQRIQHILGRGSFIYHRMQSPEIEGFSVWEIVFHCGIPLHGEGGSADRWYCVTRPTSEAVAEAEDT